MFYHSTFETDVNEYSRRGESGIKHTEDEKVGRAQTSVHTIALSMIPDWFDIDSYADKSMQLE